MDQQLTAAKEIFKAARDRDFSYTEAHQIEWIPRGNDGEPMRLNGQVATVKTGYSFVAVPGYSDFFCPGSKYGAIRMIPGIEIAFTPGFSARGSLVVDPTAADGTNA